MLSSSSRITTLCLNQNYRFNVTTADSSVMSRRKTNSYCSIGLMIINNCSGVELRNVGIVLYGWRIDINTKSYIGNKSMKRNVLGNRYLKNGSKINQKVSSDSSIVLVLLMKMVDLMNSVMVFGGSPVRMFIFDPGGGITSVSYYSLCAINWNSQLRNWQASIHGALLESNVTSYNGFNLDHVIGTKIGGSTFDGFGRRHTAAGILNHAKPSNVRVALHASVERILFNTLDSTSPITPTSSGFAYKRMPVAIGASYCDRMGKSHHAMVRGSREVILCAGAIGNPQMLLLSGIGLRSYLSSWGILVVQHLPYVGQYLCDNPCNGTTIVPPVPMEHSLIQVVGITDAGTYIANVISFTSLHLTVATIMEKIVGPLSYGSLRLASREVRVSPLIRFYYFSNAEDLGRCVHGMRKIGELLRGRSLEEFKFQEWFGGRDFRFVGTTLLLNQSDDQLMEDFCRMMVSTIWHYNGGCTVGKVVESDHRVIGVDNLSIVGRSILSVSPGTNPQATVMMMGRRIVEERRRSVHRR